MKKYQDGCYDTTKGIALIAKVLAGHGTMNYTRASVGKGNLTDDQDPMTMEKPADYVMDAKITAVTIPVDGECQITVQISSKDVSEGFYCTGIVLYAEDPDEGEVPFTYMVLENEPEYIRPSDAIVGKLATFEIVAAVGAVDNVTAIVDPTGIATVENVKTMIESHNKSKASHANLAPTFTQAEERANLTSGEKLTVMLGKLSKWFADLKSVAFSGKYTDLTGAPGEASNSAAGLMSAADKRKLDGIAEGANVTSVNGQTGAVTVTPANIGAVPASQLRINTSDTWDYADFLYNDPNNRFIFGYNKASGQPYHYNVQKKANDLIYTQNFPQVNITGNAATASACSSATGRAVRNLTVNDDLLTLDTGTYIFEGIIPANKNYPPELEVQYDRLSINVFGISGSITSGGNGYSNIIIINRYGYLWTGGKAWDSPTEWKSFENHISQSRPGADQGLPGPSIIDEVQAMLITAQINTLSVDDATALRWRTLYPEWKSGVEYKAGEKVQYEDRLFRCLQANTSQAGWEPENTPALWTEICESHAGTAEDPIPYNGNMALEEGKYYSQDGVTYRCTRDTGNPVYNPLAELVGLYVEAMEG